MTNLATIETLNRILKNTPAPESNITKSDFLKYNTGSVWKTTSANNEFPFVMIIEELEHNKAYNAVPLFRWTESAGPEDLFLPRNFMGTPMIISFELEFSLTKDELKEYKGTLNSKQFDYIINAREDLQDGGVSENFTWGFPYLNKYDARYHYHEELAAEIEILQQNVLSMITEKEMPMLIPFPSLAEESINTIAAAGMSDIPLSREFTVADMDNTILRFNQSKDRTLCIIEVFDDSGAPADTLNGYTLLDDNGNKIGEIDNSSLTVDIGKIINGVTLNSPEGKVLSLEEK